MLVSKEVTVILSVDVYDQLLRYGLKRSQFSQLTAQYGFRLTTSGFWLGVVGRSTAGGRGSLSMAGACVTLLG